MIYTDHLQVLSFITLRCNLDCAFCTSRMLPVKEHGKELSGDEWCKIIDECPSRIQHWTFSGGEPTLHPGFVQICEKLRSIDSTMYISTNLAKNPAEWLLGSYIEKVVMLGVSLQFLPDDPRAETFWKRLDSVQFAYPDLPVELKFVVTTHTPKAVEGYVQSLAEGRGIKYVRQVFMNMYMYRDFPPKRDMTCDCTGGKNFAVLMPDSQLYRCYGQALTGYSAKNTRVSEKGWVFPSDAEECRYCVCMPDGICDDVRKTNIVGSQELPKADHKWIWK